MEVSARVSRRQACCDASYGNDSVSAAITLRLAESELSGNADLRTLLFRKDKKLTNPSGMLTVKLVEASLVGTRRSDSLLRHCGKASVWFEREMLRARPIRKLED